MSEPSKPNTQIYLAMYRVEDRNPHTGAALVFHKVRYLSHRPTDAEPTPNYQLRAIADPETRQLQRTRDCKFPGNIAVGVGDVSHCRTWSLCSVVVSLENFTPADLDSELALWATDADSRAALKTALWKLLPRKVTPDRDIRLEPINWGLMARPVADDDEDAPVVVVPQPRPSLWQRLWGV